MSSDTQDGKTSAEPAKTLQAVHAPPVPGMAGPPVPGMAAPLASPADQLQKTGGNNAVNAMLAGGGQKLSPDMRLHFERRFGADFGGVRIHDTPRAAEMTRKIGAKAFTAGQHIAFSSGRFSPDTAEGKRLLGHELAHVVQQGRGGAEQPTTDGSGALESEAGRAGQSAANSDGGPISVSGASAAGIAAEPELPWYKRLDRKITGGYAAAKADVTETYDKYANQAQQAVDDTRAAWNKTELKQKLDKAIDGKTLEEQMVEKLEANQPKPDDHSAKAEFIRSATGIVKATAKLDSEPTRAGLKALVNGHPVQAVKDWQNSTDGAMKEMKTATFDTINKWEDGSFEGQTKFRVDPEAHPFWSKAEHDLDSAGRAVGKRERQVLGGGTKALYSMVEGIKNIGVHPVNTLEGVAKISQMGSPIPDADTLEEGGKFASDAWNGSFKNAFKNLYKNEKEKQAARQQQTAELLKGIGHNYVEAAGGEFVPPVAEQNEDQKKRFAGKKPGEINWEGMSKRERWGEVPGLLAVDVGSFFMGGGEANAASKSVKAASVVADLGKGGEVVADVGKTTQVLNDASKLGDATKLSDAAKVTDATKVNDAAKITDAAKADDAGKLAEVKPPEVRPVDPPATPPSDALPAPRDIKTARGLRYDPKVTKALEDAPKGGQVSPLRDADAVKPANVDTPKPVDVPPDNLRDIKTGKKIDAADRANPNVHADPIPEELPVEQALADDIREAAGAEGQAPREAITNMAGGGKTGPKLVKPVGTGGPAKGAGAGGNSGARGSAGRGPIGPSKVSQAAKNSAATQYAQNLTKEFPGLAKAELKPIVRNRSVPGLWEESMYTGGGERSFSAKMRDGKAIQLDDIDRQGIVVDTKMKGLDAGREIPPVSEPDIVSQISEAKPERAWEDLSSREQIDRQLRFARENGLPGVRWETNDVKFLQEIQRYKEIMLSDQEQKMFEIILVER